MYNCAFCKVFGDIFEFEFERGKSKCKEENFAKFASEIRRRGRFGGIFGLLGDFNDRFGGFLALFLGFFPVFFRLEFLFISVLFECKTTQPTGTKWFICS